MSVKGIIKRSGVRLICTTDHPTDSLNYHKAIAQDKYFSAKVYPTFRADKVLHIEMDGFCEWLEELGRISGFQIKDFQDLKKAIGTRAEFFHQSGCRISDHSLEYLPYAEGTEEDAEKVLKNVLEGGKLSLIDVEIYKTHILLFLAKLYSELGWAMQIHLGVIRNLNGKMMKCLGADSGYDAMTSSGYSKNLAKFINALNQIGSVPKTVIYCLNEAEYETVVSIAGCFQEGPLPGKIQLGPAWWFNDHKQGIEKLLTVLKNYGLLSKFIGMQTDSRSILSYSRHEYFRRVLCNQFGNWVKSGEFPHDIKYLGGIVQDICFHNANRYFGMES